MTPNTTPATLFQIASPFTTTINTIIKFKTTLLAACAIALITRSAPAVITVTIGQIDGDVVISVVGTANLTDLSTTSALGGSASITPSSLSLIVGDVAGQNLDLYQTIAGPSGIGPGSFTAADGFQGDAFGINMLNSALMLPPGYVSGDSIGGTAFFESTDLFTLGITEGTYTYTWGSGPNADSLVITTAVIPEPSTTAALAGLAALGFVAWRRGCAQ